MTTEVVGELLLALLEFDAFHKVMLSALADAAATQPEAAATLQAMAEADRPEARRVLQQVVAEMAPGIAPAAEGEPAQQRLTVVVPEGVCEGQELSVTAPDGRVFTVAVPAGVAVGQSFEVSYS
eukprot:TRINITY_DN11566_c1_g1_i1.p2 TRINITY_DN11566_c1_g1~~TRINITY_DN11566_c1_g1_i1.p2  ORF type:complete len:124 (+),score=32.15 TRINITY_DN11566_c1_g1_i1:383-754(+)